MEEQLGLKWVATLEEGIREADFISVNAPLTKETRHMSSTDQFDLMKPNAVLINTARGELVNTESLYEALVKNKIAGAGVDVIDPEPLSSDHPLLAPRQFYFDTSPWGTQRDIKGKAGRRGIKYLRSLFDQWKTD